MAAKPKRLAKDLWRWTARHPEWHPGEFGSEVASFALQAGDETILVDPLLPPEPQAVLDLIESKLRDRLSILVSIPYHVRSSEQIRERFKRDVDVGIWGHPACAKRLTRKAGFHAFAPGDPLPGDAQAFPIGKPRRHETPLLLPSHSALVFGDAVVEVDGRLRVWALDPLDAKVAAFYRDRFNPTLEPLLEQEFDRVLVTHGQPLLEGGRTALRAALRAKPWYRNT